MRSYDNPLVVTYNFAQHDFGAGAGATSFKAPAGFSKGQIIDVGVKDITETFTAVTTPAFVRLGTTGDADAYAELNMATAAATDTFNTQDDADAIIEATITSTQVEVTYVAPTGGTPAGIGSPYVVVAWF